MIKIENVVLPSEEQWKAIIRGMRNPKNSWNRSDSEYNNDFVLGENDKNLMTALVQGGPVHAKFRRMIPVFFDLTATLYWWKEFDTYKVGTVRNSCSTMHKITAKEFDWSDFSTEQLSTESAKSLMQDTIDELNKNRKLFIETNDKKYWWNLIQLLPSSYNQKSTIFLNYEVLHNMYKWRKSHKLDEWKEFCHWIETLPYAKELIIGED